MRLSVRVLIAGLFGVAFVLASTGSAFAQAPCNANPADAQKSQALEAMGAGVAFLQDPEGARYEDAYPQFKKAYELSCSVNALQNLALCEMNLELDGEAITHYAEVLQKKTDLAEGDRRQIESDLARLKASVAWITFSSDKPNVQLIDERTPNRGGVVRNKYQIGIQQKQIGIHPGVHVFTANTADGLKVAWNIDVKAGSRHNHEFSFANVTPTPGPGGPGPGPQPIVVPREEKGGIPIFVWIGGGVTVASAVVMATMMGLSASKKSDYDDNLLGKAPVQEQEDAAADIKTFSAVADVFIGVTVAAAAATVILFFVFPPKSETANNNNNKEGPKFGVDYTVVPTVGPESGGAAVTIRF